MYQLMFKPTLNRIAGTLQDTRSQGKTTVYTIFVSPFKNVVVTASPATAPEGARAMALVDQHRAGNWTDDPAWCRWQGTDATITVDLGKDAPVKSITAGFFHETVRLVFPPSQIEVSISHDGTTFSSVAVIKSASPSKQPRPDVMTYNAVLEGVQARYVRLTATGVGPAPAWHKRAGQPTWLFADEIIIE